LFSSASCSRRFAISSSSLSVIARA
jgi:hypothetical protein